MMTTVTTRRVAGRVPREAEVTGLDTRLHGDSPP